MNCRQFEQYLDQYLDGELEGTLKLEFEAHLVDCERCGHEFAVMEAMGEIISAPAPREPRVSDGFADRVMVELSSRKGMNLRFRRVMTRASLAAAIMLVVTGTVLYSSHSGKTNSPIAGKPVLMASSDNVGRELNGVSDLVAETFEQAGMTLLELKDLKSSTVDQVRRGIVQSFAGPSATPVAYPVSTDVKGPARSVGESGSPLPASPPEPASESGNEWL